MHIEIKDSCLLLNDETRTEGVSKYYSMYLTDWISR